jgi:hypothetical protein
MIKVYDLESTTAMNQFKIQNSKFKIKDSHPQGVGFLPTL